VSGVVEQWVEPILMLLIASHNNHTTIFSGLRGLRFLRLMRVARIMKVAKKFIYSDLSWTERPTFQWFITGVIILNTFTLSAELDIPWGGWFWMEHIMLAIYLFEVLARLQMHGRIFFTDPQDKSWNLLDFSVVVIGVVEQWLTPMYHLISKLLGVVPISFIDHKNPHSGGNMLSLLRLLRLVRVLRLVKLIKTLRPLYKICIGCAEAIQGLEWALLLTAILLYANAVAFTSLVGHEQLFGQIPEEAKETFSTIPGSMFELFRVMNHNLSPLQPFIHSANLRILFISFVVLSNWIIFSVLTAIVSDSMLTSTAAMGRLDADVHEAKEKAAAAAILLTMFRVMDKDSDGYLDEAQFTALLRDDAVRDELKKATNQDEGDLKDMFSLLSVEHKGTWHVDYTVYVETITCPSKNFLDHSVFRLNRHIHTIEKRVTSAMKDVLEELRETARFFELV